MSFSDYSMSISNDNTTVFTALFRVRKSDNLVVNVYDTTHGTNSANVLVDVDTRDIPYYDGGKNRNLFKDGLFDGVCMQLNTPITHVGKNICEK